MVAGRKCDRLISSVVGLSRLTWAAPVLLSQRSQPEANDATNEQQGSDLAEQQQLLRLQPQAQITLLQAIQTAETEQRGRATSTELETENSSLVYAVDIGLKEVIVDAGNGRILATEDLTQPHSRNPQWRGSVPVSGNSMGDGNGETQDNR
ncbi:MAG: PepSY domain-containing protein [Chroococcidiopsidaceae cyanobacterium CP_BM_ER_R8_30]|nr:PepSY domain-containing protein [Chroococcidiopsidaceae cyanobacterium CP_BM_ER_R8_30]